MLRHRSTLVVIVITVFLLVVLALFLSLRETKSKPETRKTNTVSVKDSRSGLIITKDSAIRSMGVDTDAKARGQLWKLRQPTSSKTEFAIDANYEEGESLKKIATFTKKPLREAVVENVNLQLPKQYPQYKELTQRNLTVNGFEANETIFEYVASDIKIKQRLLLLFKNSSTAVYIRGQVPAENFTEVNKRYFEPLFSSANFE